MSEDDAPRTRATRGRRVDMLGRFRLESVLGSGGFGTVYAAVRDDGMRVALKVLAQHMMTKELIARFEREAWIRIEHPNVVHVIDAGREEDGTHWIAFELLEGEVLSEVLRRAPLPAAEVVPMIRAIAEGLAAAHAQGIVHRDLKPGNVFRTREGAIKVLDFGIARTIDAGADQNLTTVGSVVGTPGYLAPEQARAEVEVDQRADLWALGVIAYEALSGVSPFRRETAMATILAVVIEEAAPLAAKAPPMPPGLAEIVHRCLDKSLDKRWDSATRLSAALDNLDLTRDIDASETSVASAAYAGDEQRVMALLLADGVLDADALRKTVESYGGELIPMLGGRALGVFGRTRWEGDEAGRAVMAAMDARQGIKGVAVATGRATGSGNTISGDALRAVERACAARVAGVAVDVRAARSLVGKFTLVPHGKDVVEVKSELGRASLAMAEATELPLLGREAELARIDDAIAAAFEDERTTVLWVQGQPGAGKTRLRYELEQKLRNAAGRPYVLSGRAVSHRRNAAHHVIAELLRTAPGLREAFSSANVDVGTRRTAIERFAGRWMKDVSRSRELAEVLGELLGVAEPSEGRRSDPQLVADRMRLALADLFLAIVDDHALSIVIDDGQWADAASLAMLTELCERQPERPLLVALTARPQLAESEPTLFAGLEVIRVEPRPLRAAHVWTLATAVAGHEVPEAIAKAIAERTGGNPFFVEQIVRELSEQGRLASADLGEIPIPLDVEAAVQSRLDHLPPKEKELCKAAAVLGRPFGASALSSLGMDDPEPLLASLVKRGVFAIRRAPVELRSSTDAGAEVPSAVQRALGDTARTEREHQWKSALLSEVAYAMNPPARREDLHRRAATYLATDPSIPPEELARHHELGGSPDEASALYARGALAAARRADSMSVRDLSERALELGLPPHLAFDVHMARADALSFLGRRDDQAKELDKAFEHAQSDADRARALTERTAHAATVSATDEGVRVGDEAVALARRLAAGGGDVERDILASALVRLGWVHLYAGRVLEANALIGEASAMLAQGLGPDTAALVTAWKAQLATARGDLGQRKAAYEEAIARYKEAGDLRRVASAECNLADTLNRVGDYEGAEIALREALEGCRRVGNRVVEGFALVNLGYALMKMGRSGEALEAYTAAEKIAEAAKQHRLAIAVRVYRTRARLGRDDNDEVARDAERIADQARRAGLQPWCVSALAVGSEARLLEGNVREALDMSTRAMTIRDEIGSMEEDESEVFLAHARALIASGKKDEARAVVAIANARLEFLAGRIEDTTWRARYLTDVAANRALIELAAETAEL